MFVYAVNQFSNPRKCTKNEIEKKTTPDLLKH